ncbi:hypothetical protein EGW08_005264 [Elysia chlorotica]|uniref:GPI ethanolamine phosphate transferase 2 C-terminal domain-containing protein n=1 Tax=Elysia chlorotica TaxID=188477 RepID=A0A433TZC9_ELYCH|nr:hypothetical protein EGW08_005264 [Elysia chlorotica]
MTFTVILRLFATLFVLGLFLKGFFPLKKSWDRESQENGFSHKVKRFSVPQSGQDLVDGEGFLKANIDDEVGDKNGESLNSPGTVFLHDIFHPRVILMIIDAFREDFAYGPMRFMPLTHGILSKGKGLKFTAETMPPTVTLPRIKAMMTGSTSSFADVILNFGSSALEEDNVISRLQSDGRHVIFFGDDTWLKLFPQHFERSDGTTSFFVSDYTEVDDNVTRHLKTELEKPTWDMMILHYLGLDHIGHFAGPRSPLIGPKLAEMDTIISRIYTAMEKWVEPSMLIVCGDHGMSDQGGHGGASPGEISVPVIILSPQISNPDPKHSGTISQTDMCPTLAVLLGVPIPMGNIGKVVTEALLGYSLQQKVAILHHNARQAMEILRECVSDLHKESAFLLLQETETRIHKWQSSKNSSSKSRWESQGQSLITSLSESLSLISEKVSKLATSYDVYAMAIAIVLMWMMLVSLVFGCLQEKRNNVKMSPASSVQFYMATALPVLGSAVLSHIIMCTGGVPSDAVCSRSLPSALIQAALFVIFVCLAVHIICSWPSLETVTKRLKAVLCGSSLIELLLLVGTVLHTVSLLSSSFVEEEHQTFYFLATTLHVFIFYQLVVTYLKGFHTRREEELFRRREITDTSDQTTGEYQTYTRSENANCPVGEPYADSLKIENSTSVSKRSFLEIVDTDKPEEDANLLQQAQSEVFQSTSNTNTNSTRLSTNSFLHWAFSVLAVLLMLRVLRRWNHTGNKWLDIPDFGDWMIMPANKAFLSIATVFSFMIIGASRGSRLKRVQTMCVNLALCCAYLCRAAQGSLIFPYRKLLSSSGVLEARASYFFIAATCLISLLPENFFKLDNRIESPQSPLSKSPSCKSIGSSSTSSTQKSLSGYAIKESRNTDLTPMSTKVDSESDPDVDVSFSMQQRLRGVMAAVVCFCCLVKQPHNAPVSAAMSLAEQIMTPVLIQAGFRPVYSLLYTVWMGQVFFFLQGNSNSLSTVDIAAGYIGLDDYWPVVSGLLLFMTTYVGPIFWSLAFLNFLFQTQEQHTESGKVLSIFKVLDSSCQALLLTRVLPLSVYMALVAAQRYHLFVWSVFSPKMLYEAANTVVVGLQLLVFIAISTLSS